MYNFVDHYIKTMILNDFNINTIDSHNQSFSADSQVSQHLMHHAFDCLHDLQTKRLLQPSIFFFHHVTRNTLVNLIQWHNQFNI